MSSTALITPPAGASRTQRREPQVASVAPAEPLAGGEAEVHRWALLMAVPFVVGAACFAGAISTGAQWLMGAAFFAGPEALIVALIYLGLTSDANTE